MDGTLLHFAIERRWYEVANFLTDQGADVNAADSTSETPLQLAIWQNNLELVKCLVKHGAFLHSESDRHSHPLHQAVHAQSLEIIEFLVSAGADIHALDCSGETAIECASALPSRGIINFLLSCGATKSIHVAAAIGDLQTVEQYISAGGDPNIRSGKYWGCPPLYAAAIHNQLEVVEFLIRSGAVIDMGCEQDTYAIVEFLIKNGAKG